jgi:hypothetical protein
LDGVKQALPHGGACFFVSEGALLGKTTHPAAEKLEIAVG